MDSTRNRRSTDMARWLGAASLVVLTVAMTSPAQAQAGDQQATAPAATTDAANPAADSADADQAAPEIVVTGFRSSLAKALSIKQTENASVDTILAEDIGKFPDLNLSESIQRVPGVALQRDGGEGRQITVRGLGPQFTRV
ncbi:MAG: hypothetical protein JWO25_608, partial [Alphaproteobacteria bacterium]|nr:hypothetical protein [Alphaproteobacteria bacterium]